ncbi:MAG: hypothetical protein SFV21_15730 [Rhodospirillaceae bacterium]|nr:hypothetical protein [Rhodospirillaceae bacterium]
MNDGSDTSASPDASGAPLGAPLGAEPAASADALARRYLELWQAEMARLAQDPGAAGVWAGLAQSVTQAMMQSAAASFATTPSAGPAHDRARSDAKPFNWPNPWAQFTPHGAAPTAAAPGDGGVAAADVLRRIDARLDALERRLAALEADPPTRRRSRAPKP